MFRRPQAYSVGPLYGTVRHHDFVRHRPLSRHHGMLSPRTTASATWLGPRSRDMKFGQCRKFNNYPSMHPPQRSRPCNTSRRTKPLHPRWKEHETLSNEATRSEGTLFSRPDGAETIENTPSTSTLLLYISSKPWAVRVSKFVVPIFLISFWQQPSTSSPSPAAPFTSQYITCSR